MRFAGSADTARRRAMRGGELRITAIRRSAGRRAAWRAHGHERRGVVHHGGNADSFVGDQHAARSLSSPARWGRSAPADARVHHRQRRRPSAPSRVRDARGSLVALDGTAQPAPASPIAGLTDLDDFALIGRFLSEKK